MSTFWKTSERWQKIGFSNDPEQRAESFQGLPFCVWLGNSFPVHCRTVELTILNSLSQKRVRGEWFVLAPEEIALFKSVAKVEWIHELPEAFRTVIVFERPVGTTTGRRQAHAWFRKAKNQWYTTRHRRPLPLGVYGIEKRDAAEAGAQALLADLDAKDETHRAQTTV